MPVSLARVVLVMGSLAACVGGCSSAESSSPGGPAPPAVCAVDAECAASPATPLCDTPTKACVALPPGHEIGYRDGAPASVTLTAIYAPGAAAKPVDLAFRGETQDELWVVGYGDNSLHRGAGLTTDAPTFKRILDPAAGHFMLKPPAIAMGTDKFFGTCGDNLNEHGGGDGSTRFFMGPALFSTDPAILGVRTSGGLGSHMDMLHNSPLCRGIAHVRANIYWVFNALDHSLDKYDFHEDHGPGNDDHSDGEIHRYAMGQVKGLDGTPSHLFFDAEDDFLYVADTGNARIVRLDTTKGTKGASLERINEPLADQGVMNGTAVEEIVAAGTLASPSGLEVHGGLIYVTDAASSSFHVFDKTGRELRKLQTELPAGSLAGLAFGPGGKIYFTDKVGGKIYRIDPL
ncbi:MAG TPA: hypothetical protein VLT33_29530 [Labilithrix sp.]|nr:hypothetical protein [Labilithrix sp.]